MNQQPAGKEIKTKQKPLGTRVMVSNNATIMPTLKKFDNIEYLGNALLNANK